MSPVKITALDVLGMPTVDFPAKDDIKWTLMEDFGLSNRAAEKAIVVSKIELIFRKDPAMAAHTSNEAWARYVYEAYRKRILAGCRGNRSHKRRTSQVKKWGKY